VLGPIESVAVVAPSSLVSLAGARVSILWGDPAGESGGGGLRMANQAFAA